MSIPALTRWAVVGTAAALLVTVAATAGRAPAARGSDASDADSGSAAMTVRAATVAGASQNVNPGVSFEESILASPQVLASPQLRQLLRNLGTSTMRFGANGSSKVMWGGIRVAGRTTITVADLKALAALSKSTGWGVVLATNLFVYSPQKSAAMLAKAESLLGNRLVAAEFGNEPDYFRRNKQHARALGATAQTGATSSYPASEFVAEWNAYRAALAADPSTAALPVVGPSLANLTNSDGSLSDYASAWLQSAHRARTDVFSQHTYTLSSCAGGTWTYSDLLGSAAYARQAAVAAATVKAARKAGLAPVLGERNSVACWGQPGLSNRMAAALWALDSQLEYARAGITQQYVHTLAGACDTAHGANTAYDSAYYSLWCAPVGTDVSKAQVVATPPYYGLLAAHLAGDGEFLRTSWPNGRAGVGLRLYALRQSGRLTLVVLNLGDSSRTAEITLPKAWTGSGAWTVARQADLTSAVHDPYTADGVSLGGGTADAATGAFTGLSWQRSAVSGGRIAEVQVPAYSAAIVRVG